MLLMACESRSLLKNYRPMIVEGYEWTILRTFDYDPDAYAIEVQRIEGDSVIGKYTYKKLMAQRPETSDQWKVLALLREDAKEQKIYIWTGDIERLKYDFGMSVGDYAPLYISEYLDHVHRDDVVARLDRITERVDLKGEKFRVFHYTAILNDDEYEDEQSYVLYERFGARGGIFYMFGVMEVGGGSASIQEVRDEHGDVVLTGEGLPYY